MYPTLRSKITGLVLAFLCTLATSFIASAQTSPSGQLMFEVPNAFSACNTDTVCVTVFNNKAVKGLTYVGPVKLKINIPGGALMTLIPGSLTSVPAGAVQTSYTGNVLSVDVPLGAVGEGTKVCFLVRPDCNIGTVTPLPVFTAQATYPAGYPDPMQTVTSGTANVGKGILTATPFGGQYSNAASKWGVQADPNYDATKLTNTGYGDIKEVLVKTTVPNKFTNPVLDTWRGNFTAPNVAGVLVSQTTNPDGSVTYVHKITGAALGSDNVLSSGETVVWSVYFKAPAECTQGQFKYEFSYSCGDGQPACEAPVKSVSTRTVRDDFPNPVSTLVVYDKPDGCNDFKKYEFDWKNSGTTNGLAYPLVTGVAYDVEVAASFGGSVNVMDLTINGVAVNPLDVHLTTGPALVDISRWVFTFKDKNTNPAYGLVDIDGDGFLDDMPVGTNIPVKMKYQTDLVKSCTGSDYYIFNFMNYKDICRTLKTLYGGPYDFFGFKRLTAPTQTSVNNYGIIYTSPDTIKTQTAKFEFNYSLVGSLTVDPAATAKLKLRQSEKMEINPATVKLNGTLLTLTSKDGAGVDQTSLVPGASDADSVLIYDIPSSMIASLTDGTKDELEYDVTAYNCLVRQKTKQSDSWSLCLKFKDCGAAGGGEIDLGCKQPFVHSIQRGCGSKPCYVQNTKVYRSSPTGFTAIDELTPIAAIDSMRSYECDTIMFNNTTYINGDWPAGQPNGYYTAQGKQVLDGLLSFNIAYKSSPAMLAASKVPFKFLENESFICVWPRDPVTGVINKSGAPLAKVPVQYNDFTSPVEGNNSIATDQSEGSYYGGLQIETPTVGASRCVNGGYPYLCAKAGGTLGGYYYHPIGSMNGITFFTPNQDWAATSFQLNAGKALFDYGFTTAIWNDDNYAIEYKLKWKPIDNYDWDTNSDFAFDYVNQVHYGNYYKVNGKSTGAVDFADYTSKASDFFGSCGVTAVTGLIAEKDLYVENPGLSYVTDCGTTICNKLYMDSYAGQGTSGQGLFRNNEVRVPYKLNDIKVTMPAGFSLVPGSMSLKTNSGCATSAPYTNITASATTGLITFTNTAGGDFPRMDDCAGQTTAYEFCYQIKDDNGAVTKANLPLYTTFNLTEEKNKPYILKDTATLSNLIPDLRLISVSPVIRNTDGGACQPASYDFILYNESDTDASFVHLTVDNSATVTMTSIKDALAGTAGVDSVKATSNGLFAYIGKLAARDSLRITIQGKTNVCSGTFKVVADWGCAFPPKDITTVIEAGSTHEDVANASFDAADPKMLSKPVTNEILRIEDLCGERDVEFEVRNSDLPNLYKLKAGIKLPASMDFVVGSMTITHPIPSGTPQTVSSVSVPATDSLAIDFSTFAPFNTACGLTGSDTTTRNNVRIKFRVKFDACPTTLSQEIKFTAEAENYCGKKAKTLSILPVIYVGTGGNTNKFTISSKSSTLDVCANKGETQKVNDVIYIKNLGGGLSPAVTSGNDSLTLSIPYNAAQLTVSNFTVPAPYGPAVVGVNAEGNPTYKILVPAGIKPGDSLAIPIMYDLTPKVDKLCKVATQPPLCYFAEFSTRIILKCDLTGLNCTSTMPRRVHGTGISLRGFNCCYGSIGDTMWVDANNDGKQDVGEAPVPNQKVYLYEETAPGVFTKVDSTTTDANGRYLFDSLLTGKFQVGFTKPAGSVFAKKDVGADGKDSDADLITGKTGTYNINSNLPVGDPGRDNRSVDAGIVPLGEIGNFVWEDTNKDGVQDPGEPGIKDVKVYLLDGAGTKIDSTLTDGTGAYKFDSLPGGTYSVEFKKPTGFDPSPQDTGAGAAGSPADAADSDADPVTGKSAPVVLAPAFGGTGLNTVNPTLDAGFTKGYGSIGDTMWVDADNDGIQDAGEAPVPNQKVYLYKETAPGVFTKVDSTTTDANGKYLFDSLVTGNYQVGFTKPAGSVFSKKDIGADGDDSDADIVTGRTGTYNIDTTKPVGDPGRDNRSVDAGTVPLGEIGNFVWEDKNNDGVQNAGEPGIKDVVVYLLDGSGTKIDSTKTDALGAYKFDSLVAGTYSVEFKKPTGFDPSPQDTGAGAAGSPADAADSDADPVTGKSSPVTLAPVLGSTALNTVNPTLDAGFSKAYGSIGDTMWVDADDDGIQDSGEAPVPNQKVYLYKETAPGVFTKVDSTTTDATGKYLFDSLVAGNYQVGFTKPAGSVFAKKDIGADGDDSDADIVTGRTGTYSIDTTKPKGDPTRDNRSVDAGIVPLGEIGNFVWEDKDKDGVQDAGEPGIKDVKVYLLDGAGARIDSTVTDVNGAYKFDSLKAGTYSVEFKKPLSYDSVIKDNTTDDKDSDADPVTGKSGPVTLTPVLNDTGINTVNPTVDAGFSKAYGSIGDTMWVDADNDGIQDAGEAPVVNQKVYLYKETAPGVFTKVDSTITDPTGKYLFDSLDSGNYKVSFTKPAGTVFAKKDIGADGDDSDADGTGLTGSYNIDTTKPLGDPARDNRSVDAGIVPLGEIGNFVWEDKDKDGVQDAGEPGLPGVKVYLLDGAGTKIDSTVTDGNGAYKFDSLVAGQYSVEFKRPTSYDAVPKDATADDKDSDADPVTGKSAPVFLTPVVGGTGLNTVNPTVDAGFSKSYGSIGDTMWVDADKDGVQDAGEAPVPNQKVYLYKETAPGVFTKVDSTTTDANGRYLFDSLESGNFKVQFTNPVNSIFTKQNIGADGDDSDADGAGLTGSYSIDTTKPAGDPARDNRSVDAGVIPVGKIGDYVWKDLDEDGLQDAGEPPVAGVKVYLLDAAGMKIDSTVTDANGKYVFDSLDKGTYSVQFVAPAGMEFTLPNFGSIDAIDSDAAKITGKSPAVVLNPTINDNSLSTVNLTVDAGLVPAYGSIGDTMWVDANNDGIQDVGEAPVPNQKVYLYKETAPGVFTVVDSTTTNASGKYLFDSLSTGNYQVGFTKPSGTVFAKKDIGADGKDSDANTMTGKTGTYSINTALPAGDPGRDNRSVDAGIVPLGEIGNFVFEDKDADGVQDAGEPGIAGVKVYLLDAAGTKIDSTVTDANGAYKFDSVLAGTYTVEFKKPTSYDAVPKDATTDDKDSDADPVTGKSAPITMAPVVGGTGLNTVNPTVDAGFSKSYGSIGDTIWVDADNDGIQDAGEAPVPNQKVYLYKETTPGVFAVVDSTTTDANGKYLFDSLVSGNYQVGFTKPVGTVFSKKDIGADGDDSDANTTTGKTGTYSIDTTKPKGDPARDNRSVDAGIVPLGEIGNFVFEDKDADGVQDAGEPGIPGVKVYLLDAAGMKIDSTVTDANGAYKFDSVLAGTYTVEFKKPTSYDSVPKDATTDDKDSDADPVTGKSAPITMAPVVGGTGLNTVNPTVDAGFSKAYGSIGDTMWVDANKDGKQDVGEAPVPNQKVYLYKETTPGVFAVIDSTTTDANGKYLFDSLVGGNYKVKFTPPTNSKFTSQNIGADGKDSDADPLTGLTGSYTIDTTKPKGDPARDNRSVDAGVIPIGKIGDYVWKDLDGDGLQDAGEPAVAGVKVYLLDGSGNKIDSTVTDANGKYVFDSLVNGTYGVQFVAPAGMEFTSPNIGSIDAIDSDAATGTGKSPAIFLNPAINDNSQNTVNLTVDAGLVPAYGSIGDTMWVDADKDGMQDAGEAPIPNQKVYLYKETAPGVFTKVDSTMTNAMGMYLFDSLATGNYKVEFTKPISSIFTKKDIGPDGDDSDANGAGMTGVYNIDTTKPKGSVERDNRTVDAGIIPVGSIGNYVWNDTDQDGLQDAGEPAQAGVKVYLLDGSGNKIDSTVTDATGKYLFDSLDAGTYFVQFVAPAGKAFTLPNIGSIDAIDSDANSLGKTAAVFLTPVLGDNSLSTNNPTIDAGLVPAYGSIGDTMWVDADNDGMQDAGEAPVPNQKVYLYKETTPGVFALVDSTTTNAGGKYLFDSLVTGNYQVGFTKPTGTVFTKKDIGADGKDSDANTMTGRTGTYSVNTSLPSGDPGRDNRSVDAGIVPLGEIGNFVWYDLDKDGRQDAGEPGVAGVKVYLIDVNTGLKIDSTLTDANGAYLFDSVKAGNYQVQFVKPAGRDFTDSNIGTDDKDSDALPNGLTNSFIMNPVVGGTGLDTKNTTIDAGLNPGYGSIGDTMWVDADNDGVQDAGEAPVPNQKVYLYKETAPGVFTKVDSTMTDAMGKYLFDSLLSGNYKVKFTNPAGSSFAKKDIGADGDDSDADKNGLTGAYSINTLLPAGDPGRDNRSVDAGITPIGSIGSTVWNDTNANGQLDGTESPKAGVKVYLLDGAGNKIDSTVTDVNGKYLFDSLPAGTYKVKFVAPAGLKFTVPNQGNDATDSDADNTGLTGPITLNPVIGGTGLNTNNPTIYAGLVVPAGLGNFVWSDTDGDGIQDAGEPGIAGVKVELLDAAGNPAKDADGNTIASVFTNGTGAYQFNNLQPGVEYFVKFTTPAGYTVSPKDANAENLGTDSDVNPATGKTDAVTLQSGEFNPKIDAGFSLPQTPKGSIGNYVFLDKNSNGVQDAGDTPVAGVKVYLYNALTGAKIDSTETDIDGLYMFTNLPKGTYKVQFELKAGYLFINPDAGADNIDSDADVVNGFSADIVLDPVLGGTGLETINMTVDAGLVLDIPKAITLQSFVGSASADGNKLKWTAKGEVDFSHFELQRSSDLKEFYSIAKEEGGASNGSYGYIDRSDVLGLNYYKLKMVDLNGTVSYSKVISIINEQSTAGLNVYPNPSPTREFNISTSYDVRSVKVYGINGTEVNFTQSTRNGKMVVSLDQSIGSGTYMISIETAKGRITRRVVVQ